MGELKRLYFEGKGSISTAYKRYMWRWEGINNTGYPSHFQMGRIRINDVQLPYTYISYAKGSGRDSSVGEMAYRLVNAESTGQYDKWVIFDMYPQSPECWGYVIFDLPEAVIPTSYYLKTTNDSNLNQFPTRMMLYGTNDLTANDPSSVSWDLLSDVSDFLLPSAYFTWSNPIEISSTVSNYYLLAPTDLAKGSGLRYFEPELLYKRYMFRWDNVLSGSVFQLSRIQIDDVELPYTFVGYGISGGNYQSNEPANAMIASTSSFSDPNNKWCMTNISGQYAWFIFDLPQSHHPLSYRLMSGNDTSFQQGRNPQRVRLYGTNEEATNFDDPSWVLLSDEYNYNNSLLATGDREWSNYIQLSV